MVARTIGSGLEWDAGYYPLDGQVLEVPNAPDRLRLLVWGADKGESVANSGVQLLPDYDWSMEGRNGATDVNIARHQLTIGGSPADRSLTLPFVIESVSGGNLMFTVHGRVEVTRR